MEPPFFRSYYQCPTPQQSSVPPQIRLVPKKTTPSQPSRKVVHIPIHFVESAQKRSNAALKIQKTFRGFRVRKTVKKIAELKREVDGVEKKLQERETMEVVKRDGMERLKINECLMNLLFRLDSVRGFNGEIREFRKKVIKKAIMLQELLDSFVVIDDDDRKMEEKDSEEVIENCEGIEENNGEICDDSSRMCVDDNSEKIDGEIRENSGVVNDNNVMESLDDFGNMQVDDSEKNEENCENVIDSVDETLEKTGEIGDETLEKTENVISEQEQMEGEIVDGGEAWECVGEETEQQKSDFVEGGDHGSGQEERNLAKETSNDEWCVVGGGDKQRESKEKLLEKMVEDNQKLMAMVADLCQKNVAQTRVICSLSQRVEQLEKAMSERLRKKKKKINNVAT